MSDTLQGLLQYGYLLLFVFVLAEQFGLPVPAVPVLLGHRSARWRRTHEPGAGVRCGAGGITSR